MNVEALALPEYAQSNISSRDQIYEVKVWGELGAMIQKLTCGEWCIAVAAEGIGTAGEKKYFKVIPMRNCDPERGKATFVLDGSLFGAGEDNVPPAAFGNAYYRVVTAVARHAGEHKPIGIAVLCRSGPVMGYG